MHYKKHVDHPAGGKDPGLAEEINLCMENMFIAYYLKDR